MPIDVIVELIDCCKDICQTFFILAIVLPLLICCLKCLYLLLKSFLADKSKE